MERERDMLANSVSERPGILRRNLKEPGLDPNPFELLHLSTFHSIAINAFIIDNNFIPGSRQRSCTDHSHSAVWRSRRGRKSTNMPRKFRLWEHRQINPRTRKRAEEEYHPLLEQQQPSLIRSKETWLSPRGRLHRSRSCRRSRPPIFTDETKAQKIKKFQAICNL